MTRLAFIFFIAIRQMRARVRSTLLLLTGMAAGIFVLVVMSSLMFGFQTRALTILLTVTPSALTGSRPREPAGEGRLFEPPPGWFYLQSRVKPAEKEKGIRGYRMLLSRLEKIEGVTATAPLCQGRAIVRLGTRESGVGLIGVDAPKYDRVVEFRRQVIGDPDEMTRRPDGCILGFLLAEELGARVGDRLQLVGARGRVRSVRLVALFQSGLTAIDRSFGFCNLRLAQALLGYEGAITGIAIKTGSVEAAPAVARRIEWASGLQTQSWQEINSNFYAVIRQQNLMTFGAVGLTLIVAGFGIANGLITAVLERRREIGILRAMGVTAGGIAGIFLMQGLLIGLAGCLIGLWLAGAAIDLLAVTRLPGRGGLSGADTFLMLRAWWLFAGTALFALLISFVATIFPAARAARYEPVEIIRHSRG